MILNVTLILCGFAIISSIWAWVGLSVVEKLRLKDPENTKQYILITIIGGPIAAIWFIGDWFFNWLKKFYNS